MTSAIPVNPASRAGGFNQEPNTFSNINDLFQFFQPRRMKVSKNSPPVLNVDVSEMELVFDRTLNRIYTVSNGVLKYVAFT